MKNRKLLLIVSLVLALTMSLGGTLAYLTDSDGDVNVMTVGRVEIKQNEQDRDGNGFEKEQQLLPIVTPAGTKDEVYNMYPADPNYIDKIVTVTNSGNTDAWVRTLIAIPEFTYEGKPVNNANGEVLHWNGYSEGDKAPSFPAAERLPGTDIDVENHWWWGKETASAWPNNGGEWNSYSGVKLFEDSDLTYTVMFVTHTTKLGAKETTAPNLLGIYLDSNVDYDNDNGYYTMNQKKIEGLTGNVKIPVLSQAVQASGFETAWEAFDEAFKLGGDPVATIIGWFGDMKQDTTGEDNVPPVFYDHIVDNLDDLKAALTAGGNIQLADDIELDKITAIEPGKEVYLNLNGKTITVDQNTTSNTLLYVKEGAKLIIDGNGTIDLGAVSTMAMFAPYGELVIENGTFIRDEVTTVTNKTTGLFMGAKITASNVTINGGYFDPGYYDKNAADIEEILAGTKTLTETEDDKAKRGNSTDANPVRVAVKDNVSVLLNHSGYGTFKVYGGTFVGANPAWGDEGCMLPTTPNYLRPWSYYQGALLDGQTFNENGIVLPDGYTITNGKLEDGRPTYTVTYSK